MTYHSVKLLYHRLHQGSPAFLKQRASSCVPINAKGYYSLIHISGKKFAQFTFSYFSIDIR